MDGHEAHIFLLRRQRLISIVSPPEFEQEDLVDVESRMQKFCFVQLIFGLLQATFACDSSFLYVVFVCFL